MPEAILDLDPNLAAAAQTSKAWPFEEARKLIQRLQKHPKDPSKDAVIFETGYGPSGLPHIGTFGEVARTAMVRHAFRVLTQDKIKTRLICFSDDMDGLRKVPNNIPNQEKMAEYLNKPLSTIPDPFATHESYAAHNNARLCAFLDQFGFDYEFISATEMYKNGGFDDALLRALECFDDILEIMLPTLGPDRRATYSPFLPICPLSGQVLQVPTEERDVSAGTITYLNPVTGKREQTLVTGGNCKLQWKPDWGMRWYALGVDYEMSGKDLIDSVKASSAICRVLGAPAPEGFSYELFLDEQGQKISKSKGNGLSIEDWLRYASTESLELFMFQKPKVAKRLYFDIIPKTVDDYQSFLGKYPEQDAKEQLGNPVWHVHNGAPPLADQPVSFALLLNLVSASHADHPEILWGFIQKYAPGVTPETHPKLGQLVGYAIQYFHDFVHPEKKFRVPSELERTALRDLHDRLGELDPATSGTDIQTIVYAVGKAHNFENLRDWFKAIYEVLLGQQRGPRFGPFVALYGIEETRTLISRALAGELG